jgi:predicted HAD superfamily Cof-like phosphohydrolase
LNRNLLADSNQTDYMPTPHFKRVRTFMQKVGQDTPTEVHVPDANTRVLRAKLILEEALETVEALGVTVRAGANGPLIEEAELEYAHGNPVDIEGVVDGCADISVVTVGTLIAFGVDDEPVLEEVDSANLRKFGPGGYKREDGKWMKPPDWTPPDIDGAIERGNPGG